MNKKMIKRVLSAALALCMLVAVMPVSTAADADELGYAGESFTYNLHMYNSNWTADKTDTNNVTDIRNITSDYTDGWALHSFSSDHTTPANIFRLSNNTQLRLQLLNVGAWAAFSLPIKAAGKYTMTINYKEYSGGGNVAVYFMPLPEEGKTVADYINDDTYKVIDQITGYNASAEEEAIDRSISCEVEAETAATYLLVIKQLDRVKGANYTFLKGIEFDGEVFGDKYAYIRETNDGRSGDATYKLVLLSAIKSLDYQKVGFEVKLGDGAADGTKTTNEVFRTVTLNTDVELTPEDLGEDNGYIFFDERDFNTEYAETAVQFRAFAVDADGNYTYGDWAEISTVAKQ